MHNHNSKKFFSHFEAIPMEEFLENYVLFDDYDEQLCYGINHLNITELLPNIKRTRFEDLKVDDLLTGRVLLVYAKYKRGNAVFPYIRPELVKERMKRNGKF